MTQSKVIADPQVVKVLLSEQAGTYLAPYMEKGRSISEAAERVERSLQRTHYWTRRLLDAGLVEVCEVIRRPGRPIRRYRSVADEFIVRAEALPPGTFEVQMHEVNRALTRSFERSYPDLVHGGDLRVRRTSVGSTVISYDRGPREGMPLPQDAVQSSFNLRLTSEEARELRDELMTLRDKWLEVGADRGPGRAFYLAVVALTPLADE